MKIEQIAALIRERSYTFQVVIPGTDFAHGKTTEAMATADAESIEAYLNRIASANKAAHLLVKLFSRNGSSFKPRGEHLIFLAQSQPVATAATNVATTATNVATTATNVAGLGSAQPKPNTMDTKDYIDFRVLQSEHNTLKGLYEESKVKIKQLDKKVDELQDENKQLIRNAAVADDKHAVAIERVKLDMDRESKQGLNGLVGDLTKDPDTLKMIVGFLKPDHPMFNKTLEGAGTSTPGEVAYSEDKDANQVLNDMPLKLSQKDGRTIGAVYLIFQELINKPEVLESAIAAYIPQFNQ